jgi:hypothetical protein
VSSHPFHVFLEAGDVTEHIAVKPLQQIIITILFRGHDAVSVMNMAGAERFSLKERSFRPEPVENSSEIGYHSPGTYLPFSL